MKRTTLFTHVTPMLSVIGLCCSFWWAFTLFNRPDEEMDVDECNPDPIAELVLSGMHETDGPVYEATEVKPPPSMQELLSTLTKKYGVGRNGVNTQAAIAFWDDTAKRFEEIYGVPSGVQLAVFAHETRFARDGIGTRGGFFGVKAGKTVEAVDKDGKGLGIEFNRFGIPDYMNLNGIDSKETWDPKVSYTGYSVTWHAFAHFNRLLRGIVWTGMINDKGHPIMKDSDSFYEQRMRRWLAVGKSLDEAWILAMAADLDLRRSKLAYHTSGCRCEGSYAQKLACWNKRVSTANKRIAWIKNEYYRGSKYIASSEDPGVRMSGI